MPMELIELCSGQSYVIVAYGREVMNFILEKCSANDRRKLLALLERTAMSGLPRNEQRFRLLEDGIYEFKAGQARLTCFFDKNRIIVCPHGFTKKQQKTRRRDIDKAIDLRAAYQEEKHNANR